MLISSINMKSHWKLVTIMIGGNDFCRDICNKKDTLLQINQDQEKNLINTLRIIRDTMPRLREKNFKNSS